MYRPDRLSPPLESVREEVKTYTADLKGLIAWLSTQDPATEYDYETCRQCVLGSFWKARTGDDFYWGGLPDAERIDEAVAKPRPHTFGATLSRARAELASRS